jgi:hypothetical protein
MWYYSSMAPQTPVSGLTGNKVLKIVMLAVLGLVALCGIAGSCLFIFLLAFGGKGQ